ncbi:response regulator [Aeromicrobium sp. CF4.19]|uniref:response regulator n=1 Tax=Aeromicrobium sp. CF4.19 TaxID=3373082 RepID=UPI003EE54DF9
MIRVLIADDQDLVRAGLRALLANDSEFTVVAEAATGDEAVARSHQHHPDVVLMDVRMPGANGIEATRRIRADPSLSTTRVLILTTFDDDGDILEAIRLGAAGYLLKDTPSNDLREAVRTVAGGGNTLSPDIVRRVMQHVADLPSPLVRDARLDGLTDRELAVLRRIAHGESNAEIASSLHISPATARTYVSRILAKLDARDRTELAVMAHRSGLYSDEDAG